jgi:RNA polymerase sigma-70 factor (ECF subfamily)
MIKAAYTFDQSKASFRTWLYTIARNCCIDYVRRRSRFSFLPLSGKKSTDDPGVDFEDILEHPDDAIEKQIFDAEIYSAISECIQNITDEEAKQAILLYYLENKVFREIADTIDRSLSTAKNRLGSAQAQVKDCLNEKGYSSW